jgi:hypothetical protein
MSEEIKTINDAEEIYKYCKERLPIMEGFELHVVQNFTTLKDEIVPIKGVTLKIFKNETVIASSTGIDVDDALLDCYKSLLLFYKKPLEKTVKITKALDRDHFSYH